MDASGLTQRHAGLVQVPYRDRRGQPKKVFVEPGEVGHAVALRVSEEKLFWLSQVRTAISCCFELPAEIERGLLALVGQAEEAAQGKGGPFLPAPRGRHATRRRGEAGRAGGTRAALPARS